MVVKTQRFITHGVRGPFLGRSHSHTVINGRVDGHSSRRPISSLGWLAGWLFIFFLIAVAFEFCCFHHSSPCPFRLCFRIFLSLSLVRLRMPSSSSPVFLCVTVDLPFLRTAHCLFFFSLRHHGSPLQRSSLLFVSLAFISVYYLPFSSPELAYVVVNTTFSSCNN